MIVLACTTVTIISCSEYKQATLSRKGIRFSFEYPKAYTEYNNAFRNEGSITLVERHLPGNNQQLSDREIRVDTRKSTDSFRVSESLASFLKQGPIIAKDFKVLDQSKVIVNNLEGQLLVYTWTVDYPWFSSYQQKNWRAYIEYKGIIWIIELLSAYNSSDGAQSDFNTVIQSFKFLN